MHKETAEQYMETFADLFEKFCKMKAIKKLDDESRVQLFHLYIDTCPDPPKKKAKQQKRGKTR